MKILYVEDDPEAQAFVSRALRESGFVVDTAGDGPAGLELAATGAYDVVILDVKLPGMSGFDVLRRLRRAGSDAPVLFLTAQGDVTDRIEGLELGADDYLAKPFALAELVARLRAIARRQLRNAKDGVLRVGDLVVDTERHHVERGGRRIQLTPKEFQLLEYLASNAGYVVSRSMIAEKIWGYGLESYSNAIDVHVNNLRKKVDRASGRKLIHTAKGLGYVLEERRDDAEPDA
jgi:two-component system copper resistance phosphate regulon response regulator CusR